YLPRTATEAGSGTVVTKGSGDAGEPATVLVAEDESVLRTLAGLVLRRSGFRVIEAEDGLQALRAAEDAGFDVDVLVTDLVMPRMGGESLATTLLARCPELKVVFMSGYAEEVVARKALMTRGSVFLAKPFAPNLLVRAVREVYGNGQEAIALQ